jgi:hypothetical protein
MIRFLFRLIVLVVVVAVVGVAYVAWRWNTQEDAGSAIGTTGTILDSERARAAGAQIAETVAVGATRAEKALAEARLTAKIKSKMALDDTIDARRIDVDTSGTVVTVTGTVDTPAQKERVLQLAKETAGVTEVVDRVTIDR